MIPPRPGSSPAIHIGSDTEDTSRMMADTLVRLSNQAAGAAGFVTLALSGGATPRRLYTLLATAYRSRFPWDRTFIFQVDERWVPWDSPDRNARLIRETLIRPLKLPSERVMLFPPAASPEASAREYESTLRAFAAGHGLGDKGAFLDIAVLGVGRDGHTASLFPGTPALAAESAWTAVVHAPAGVTPPIRLTLTLPVLNRTRQVLILAMGARKHAVVRRVLHGDSKLEDPPLPVQRVRGREGTAWFLDRAAWEGAD